MNDSLLAAVKITHGDPIAPVIFGVTGFLLLAVISHTLGVINDAVFSAIVLMVVITTLFAPPMLKAAISRQDKRQAQGQ